MCISKRTHRNRSHDNKLVFGHPQNLRTQSDTSELTPWEQGSNVSWTIAFVMIFLFAFVSIGIIHYQKQRTLTTAEIQCAEITDKSRFENASAREFTHAAVVSENSRCSFVGRNILLAGGSAVDAAISTALCLGVLSLHSAGLGGGSFMLVYNRTSRDSVVIDSREVAPLLSNPYMFNKGYKYSTEGGLSIAVPGELEGYRKAHEKFGRLPWRQLFQPAIDFCREGFAISRSLAVTLNLEKQAILRNPMLRALFVKNSSTMEIFKEGDTIKHPILARSLEIIAEEGADAFYNGSLSDAVVEEIRNANGIINRDDLLAYTANVRSSINFKLDNERTLITVPPPSAGSMVAFVLKVMQALTLITDFRLSDDELSLPYAVGIFYHRLAEAMKFAFSRKEQLSDPDFLAKTKDCRDLMSELFLSYAVAKIDADRTHPIHYYGLLPWSDEEIELEGGTSHLNVVTHDIIVSMTTSVSNSFGSKMMGTNTGIIYNNHMKEFWFDFKTCSANLIYPLRRPISFISPVIVVEPKNEGFLVLGGSGGAFIPAAVAQVIIKVLWFHESLKSAVDSRRFAHLLIPEMLMCERGYDPKLLSILSEKGHRIHCFDPYLSGVYTAVQAIRVHKNKNTGNTEIIEAYCDPRKGGGSSGY